MTKTFQKSPNLVTLTTAKKCKGPRRGGKDVLKFFIFGVKKSLLQVDNLNAKCFTSVAGCCGCDEDATETTMRTTTWFSFLIFNSQCDQICRNFATLAYFYKQLGNVFLSKNTIFWQFFSYFGKKYCWENCHCRK